MDHSTSENPSQENKFAIFHVTLPEARKKEFFSMKLASSSWPRPPPPLPRLTSAEWEIYESRKAERKNSVTNSHKLELILDTFEGEELKWLKYPLAARIPVRLPEGLRLANFSACRIFLPL